MQEEGSDRHALFPHVGRRGKLKGAEQWAEIERFQKTPEHHCQGTWDHSIRGPPPSGITIH